MILASHSRTPGLVVFLALIVVGKRSFQAESNGKGLFFLVVCADVYSVPPHVGRGGWTWYTGAAGWLYQAGIESVLGLRVRAGKLSVHPCIPSAWRRYEMTLRYKTSIYEIIVENPNAVSCTVASLELNGESQAEQIITLSDNGSTHVIRVLMGE